MWNQRYSTDKFVYGKNPNDFLKSVIPEIPKGKMLSLGEGEGRNAVFAAKLGFNVTALDLSDVGLKKAKQFALDSGVNIDTIVADLSEYEIETNSYDVIVSIFCHLPSNLRAKVNQNIVKSLRPNGYFILEGFSKDQLKYNTGGPKSLDMLFDLNELKNELNGLKFQIVRKIDREVIEGEFHTGTSSVVQILAHK